ncbi:PREDICTED: diphosphoinositol polyphosphate phosphohydrolase 1-like, partial [Rhagoletis zephyria]|uniref:diphosphoinositol polyphosphate phosphohydrolase 1-like n=1 Tax=Rhagoletis zephyria TaxID=28612 RepID=UPI00081189E0
MVKEKQTRTYDRDGYRRRAACLCVRSADESEILLVTSSRMTDHWIVPGGGVEPNEDASEAAIRETEEEAGVRGVIKRCLGDFEVCDEKRERKHRTSVYVLQVGEELTEWEDCKARLRRWFPLEEALRLLAVHKP